MIGRPDLETFEPRCLYRHDPTDAILEFVAVAAMPELHNEVVGVFRYVDEERALVATQAGFDHGETFTPLGEAIADDIGLANGP
jgi:hypothetical protein